VNPEGQGQGKNRRVARGLRDRLRVYLLCAGAETAEKDVSTCMGSPKADPVSRGSARGALGNCRPYRDRDPAGEVTVLNLELQQQAGQIGTQRLSAYSR
jgi:hypothetical protein